jgi:hypothetical protein
MLCKLLKTIRGSGNDYPSPSIRMTGGVKIPAGGMPENVYK